MNKSLLKLSILASILLSTNIQAFDLEYQLDTLQQKVSELEKEKRSYGKMKHSYLDDMNDMEDRIDFLETESALNSKMRFGANFINNYNYFDVTTADNKNYTIDSFFRSKLNLNMFSKISDDLTFDATLSMYKNWGDSSLDPSSMYDSTLGFRPNSTNIYFTRAYVNYKKEFIKDLPIVFTLGRLPSTEGPSYDFQNDSVRQATFSALAFDGGVDGIITTALTDKMTGLTNSSIRFAYGKGFQHDEGYMGASTIPKKTDLKDTNVFGIFGEAQIPGYKNSFLQAGYVKSSDMVADPSDGGLAQALKMPATTPNANVGDLVLYNASVVFKNFQKSNLDIFAHYTYSSAKPSGKTFGNYGLLSNGNDTTTKTGFAYWTGFRYNMNNGWKFGGEYNHGSKNWFSFTQGSNNIYNKLATRGNALEAYLLIPVNRYAHLKLGYININYDYTGSGSHLGEPMKISDMSNTPMGAMTLKKMNSYYFNFEVRF